MRHGLPDDERAWVLDGEKKRRKKKDESIPAVKMCEKCFAIFSAFAPACPQCGSAVKASPREIKQTDGKLELMTAARAEAAAKRREVGRANSLEDLQRIASERGYKPGWAFNVWKARNRRRVAA